MLTHARLLKLLHYSENSGEFVWRERTGGKAAPGRVAGTIQKCGHARIKIDGMSYKKSAIEYFYKNGKWPEKASGVLTQARLSELMLYDLNTGTFIRRCGYGGKAAGSHAGTFRKGYISVAVDGRSYPASRLAWLYMTGAWPRFLIDHINGIKTDNRWENLREASKSQNGWNRGPSKNNSTGFKGVWRRRGKFAADIMKNGKKLRLGCFATAEEAHAAYCKAASTLHGDFFCSG